MTHDSPQLAAQRLSQARAALSKNGAPLAEFFDALFGSADVDDIVMWDAAALAAIATAAAGVLEHHTQGQIDVKLLAAPGEGDMLVAINDDRPFLFDTALRAAAACGGRIRAAFHPIVQQNGISVSVIVLMLDVVADKTALEDGMTKAFVQGLLAVRD